MLAVVFLASVMPLAIPATSAEYWPTIMFFNSERSDLDKSAASVLASFPEQWHHAAPDCTVTIKGHSDALRFEPDGERLSRRRADATKVALEGLGVPAAKLIISYVGASEPLIDNQGRRPEPQNRRVEVFWSSPCN